MKKLSNVLIITLGFAFLLSLVNPAPVLAAATLPPLGAAASFSVLAQTLITGTSAISGDVGLNSSGAGITALTTSNVAGTIYATNMAGPSEGILSSSVQADALAAYTTNIPGQTLTSNQGPNLNGLTLTPGVYDIGDGLLTTTLTLDGPGVYIFRASSGLTSSGSVNLINGARACDVFWRVQSLATLNGGSFVGTILAGTGIHFTTANVTLNGRALAIGGDVTMITNTISGPTCAAPLGTGGVTEGTITVVKHVINDSGGTMAVADFPLFINGTKAVSGVTYNYAAPTTYNITETSNANYTRTFSGDCNASGQLNLVRGLNEFCIVTNNDIGAPAVVPLVPPLIDVVKVPSPLSLPNGPGLVTYTYTLRNIGTVPVTDITMVGDTCSPINRISGDTNNDSKLDLNETWVYTCATTLQATHTNIVTATGWANGLSATDIASAQVIVGLPIVPPLIHVTKVPSPLALLAGGGMVTYTEKISNPGVVALSNVTLNDDKCSPMKYVSGDINNDSKLDVTETWTYTCESKLTQTTTNTAIASGQANGLTVRDIAVATVVVAAAVPALPSTGFAPSLSPLNIALLAAFALLLSISLFAVLKKRLN